MFRLSIRHAVLAFLLLVVEILIAAFVRDGFVRPHLGDVLVVMLVHFTVRTFLDLRPARVALGCFLFACTMEALQAMHFIRLLGWEHNTAARLLLGDTFQWWDIPAYAAGAVIAWRIDARMQK